MVKQIFTLFFTLFVCDAMIAQTMTNDSAFVKIDNSNWYISSTSVLGTGQSEGNGGGLPQNMLDVNGNTYWSTNWNNDSPTADIILSLNSLTKFEGFYFQQRNRTWNGQWDRGVSQVALYASLDSITWNLVNTYALVGTVAVQRLAAPSISAKFVKLHIISQFTNSTVYCISEFGLLKGNAIYPRNSYAYNAGDQYTTTPINNIFDNNNETYYESDWSQPDNGAKYPHILNVDLGSVKSINKMFYVNDRTSLYQRAYKGNLRFSNDSINWSTPIDVTLGDTNYIGGAVSFPSTSARYISFSITQNDGVKKYNGDVAAYMAAGEYAPHAYATRLNELGYGNVVDENTTPVHFLSFNGHAIKYKVNSLSWITTYEQNVKRFVIYKSDDGISYNKLYEVNAMNGIANTRHEYAYTDTSESNVVAYYKLLSQDFDGKEDWYPQVITITPKNDMLTADVNFYPNPAIDVLNIKISSHLDGDKIVIYNTTGMAVINKSIDKNANIISIPVGNLASGIYILKIGNKSFKFLKK